jgi:hypothetical protein
MKKSELYSIFEKESLKETGRYKNIPERNQYEKQRIEYYWEVVSKQIAAIDRETVDMTAGLYRLFHLWSIFNPVTFYKSTNNELGGKGYNSYCRFYNDNLAIQRGFLRRVFDKRYYENYSRVEPYLPEPELVVRGEPSLPAYFAGGLLLILGYLAVIHGTGFSRAKRYMFPPAEAPGGYDEVNIAAAYGNILFIESEKQDLYHQVINVLHGRPRDFNGKITIGNRDMVIYKGIPSIFVPAHAKIAGNIKVGTFINALGKLAKIPGEKLESLQQVHKDILKKRLAELDPGVQSGLILDLCRLKEVKLYILKTPGLPGKSMIKYINELRHLKENGGLVICLAPLFMAPDIKFKYDFNNTTKKYEDMENFKKSLDYDEV